MMRTKAEVLQHFDRFAAGSRWHGLYEANGHDARNYSFLVRRRRVEELLEPWVRPGQVAADIGCGTGIMAPFLLDRGLRYHGIDLSEKMLDDARRRFAAAEASGAAQFHQGDIERIPASDRAFDLAMALGVLEYLSRPDEAVAELVRVTRPGGTICVSIPNRMCLDCLTTWLFSPLVTGAAQLARRMAGRPWQRGAYANRKYRPAAINRMFVALGCRKIAGVYYNLEVASYPLHRLSPGAALRLKRAAEPRHRGVLRVFATGYVGCYGAP